MFFVGFWNTDANHAQFIGYDDNWRTSFASAKIFTDRASAEAAAVAWGQSARDNRHGVPHVVTAAEVPRYGVVVHHDAGILARQVNALEKMGFHPVGGLVNDANRYLVQAVLFRRDPLDEV